MDLRHHQNRTPAEASVMSALAAKYGVEPQPTAAPRVTLPDRTFSSVEQSAAAAAAAAFDPAQQLWWAAPPTDAVAAALPRPSVAGGAPLTQMIMQHLTLTGMSDVANVFAQELRRAGFSPAFYDPARGQLQLPSTPNGASSLSMLLCPFAATRARISELLATGPAVFAQMAQGAALDDATLHSLVALMDEPMWGDAISPTAALREYRRSDTHEMRAAPLNALIERLTRVAYRPHVADADAELEADTAFRRHFLLIHRSFCPSRVVLAKLMQRFLVPAHLPLQLQYEGHGITINCHRETYQSDVAPAPLLPAVGPLISARSVEAAEAAVWQDLYARVSKKVQLAVMGVICEWLEVLPGHFDGAMEEAVVTFLAEVCATPSLAWAGEAPSEIAQTGERIKLLLVERRAAAAGARDPVRERVPTTLYDVTGHAALTTLQRQRRNVAAPNVEFDIEVEAALEEAAGAGPASLSASFTRRNVAAPVRWFLGSVDEARIANQLAVVDHFLLRRVPAEELLHQAFCTSSSPPAQAQAPNVQVALRRADGVMQWLVCEILWAPQFFGASDGGAAGLDVLQQQQPHHQGPAGLANAEYRLDALVTRLSPDGAVLPAELEPRAAAIVKVAALAYRCVEVNDLMSAYACVMALRHPAVVRLHEVWDLVPPATVEGIAGLRELFGFDRGYRAYRDYIGSLRDDDAYPVVPLLQITVDELRRIDAEPTVLLDSLGTPVVHWRKYAVMGSLLARFQAQADAVVPAEFVPVPAALQWIEGRIRCARRVDTETVIRASLVVQPPTRQVAAAMVPHNATNVS